MKNRTMMQLHPLRATGLLVVTTVLASGQGAAALAQSLMPQQPSVEVRLDALDALRPNSPTMAPPAPQRFGAPAATQAQPAVAPAQQTRQVPSQNPQAQAVQPSQATGQAPAASAVQTSSGMILPPPPPPVLARPEAQTQTQTQTQTQAPVVTAPQATAAPAAAVRQVPSQQPSVARPQRVPSEVVKPIAAPAQPLPKLTPKPAVAAATPAPKAVATPAPATEPKPAKTPAAAPAEPAVLKPLPEAAKPAAAPMPKLDFSQLPKASPAPAAVAAPALPPRPAGVSDADVEDMLKSLDDANASKTAVPTPAAKPDAKDTFPSLSPLPEAKPAAALPAPQGARAAASDVLVMLPDAQKAPVAAAPAAPATEDPALKNLSQRVNNLFVKEPEKTGIITDKTSVTGPAQSMPPLPPVAKVEAKPEVKPAAPPMPTNAAAPKPGSVLDKLAQGAQKAPVIGEAKPVVPELPEVAKPVFAKAEPQKTEAPKPEAPKPEGVDAKPALPLALPDLPPVPTAREESAKPKQLSLEEVNKKSPPESLRAQAAPLPVSVSKPVEVRPLETKPVQPAVIVPDAKPVLPVVSPQATKPEVAVKPNVQPALPPVLPEPAPAPLSAAKPSSAPVSALKPGAVAALPAAPVVPSSNIASADVLADILPPPNGVKVSAAAKAAESKAAEVKPSGLPRLPTLGDAPSAPGLPSLSAITGESPKSSMEIARDADGIRAVALGLPAAATKENTIPSLASDDSLPTVVRGEPNAKVAAAPTTTKAEEKKPAAAVATPEKPEPVQLASTSVPATPGAAKPATVARAVSLPIEAGKPILTVGFDKDKSDVELDMQTKIAGVADQAKKGESVRILAYATNDGGDKSAARRVSLSRALQVRAKLIEQGVDASKITVQALGDAQAKDSADIIVK